MYVWVPEVGNTADTPNPHCYKFFSGRILTILVAVILDAILASTLVSEIDLQF